MNPKEAFITGPGTSTFIAGIFADWDASRLASAAHPHQQLHGQPQLPSPPLTSNSCSPVLASTAAAPPAAAAASLAAAAEPALATIALHHWVALPSRHPIRRPLPSGSCTCPVPGAHLFPAAILFCTEFAKYSAICLIYHYRVPLW